MKKYFIAVCLGMATLFSCNKKEASVENQPTVSTEKNDVGNGGALSASKNSNVTLALTPEEFALVPEKWQKLETARLKLKKLNKKQSEMLEQFGPNSKEFKQASKQFITAQNQLRKQYEEIEIQKRIISEIIVSVGNDVRVSI